MTAVDVQCPPCGAGFCQEHPSQDRGAVRIFLGTHKPQWLPRLGVPLFISHRRMAERTALPRAAGPWALDSGGFTEIGKFGAYQTPPREYAKAVQRYMAEVGRLEWAAIQDWMCEPMMLRKTGLAVEEHQRRTVESFAELLAIAPWVPWVPVLQGWKPGDHMRHLEMYDAAGLTRALRSAPVVGVGSVCRLQHTHHAERTIRELAGLGLAVHGFGFKLAGLRNVADVLCSADSLAWSFDARHRPPLHGCRHKRCSNCQRWAMRWYDRARSFARGAGRQVAMFAGSK